MQLKIKILTVSDRAATGALEDTGGQSVQEALDQPDWHVVERLIVPDERDQIAATLLRWCDEADVDVIFTTGGTGLGPRDVTPEATADVAERLIPGVAETMRAAGLAATPFSMLSRGLAAVRANTVIINLPGSPKGAVEGVEVVRPILEHAVAILHGGRH